MSEQPRSERNTQNRIVARFTDKAHDVKQGMKLELLTGKVRLVKLDHGRGA